MGSINGVLITPLKIIENEKGDILHALKNNELSFNGFGEAYFSCIKYNEVKGWKKHTKMTLNVVVPVGRILFVLIDGREDSSTYKNKMELELSLNNYQRMTVPPGIWMGFKGIGKELNLLLNLASILHDPLEAQSKMIENNSLDNFTL